MSKVSIAARSQLKREFKCLGKGKPAIRKVLKKTSSRNGSQWVRVVSIPRFCVRVHRGDHVAMARLLLRKWFPCVGAPCPKRSTVQHLVNAIVHGRSAELKVAVRELRANLKKWQPYTTGELHYWYCHSALLLLAQSYDVRMVSRQHAVDLLDPVGTLNHIGDFADDVNPDSDGEVDDFEVFVHMAKNWNEWGPAMRKDADENDDPHHDWSLLGMRGLRAEHVRAVLQD